MWALSRSAGPQGETVKPQSVSTEWSPGRHRHRRPAHTSARTNAFDAFSRRCLVFLLTSWLFVSRSMSAPAAPLLLSDGERETFEGWRGHVGPHRQVVQARVLLMAAEGVANAVIAEEVGVTPVTVRAWRTRFGGEGWPVPAAPRGSRPQALDRRGNDRRDRAVVHHDNSAGRHALVVPHDGQARGGQSGYGATDLVGSGVAAPSGRHVQGVQRSEVRGQTHRRGGLVFDPPEKAIVLCMDEKSQIRPSIAPRRRCPWCRVGRAR